MFTFSPGISGFGNQMGSIGAYPFVFAIPFSAYVFPLT